MGDIRKIHRTEESVVRPPKVAGAPVERASAAFSAQTPQAARVCPQCGSIGQPLEAVAAGQWQTLLHAGHLRRLGVFPIPASLRISVVIPVYNECDTLEELLRRVRDVPITKQIVIVDDGSTDGTRELLQTMQNESDLHVIFHPQNRGKGAALKTGLQHATGDIVIIQDADLEYDPAEYHRLIQPIVEQKADVVYGSRFLGGNSHRVLYYWHAIGNRLLTTMSNMFTNLNLTDMETCYKVFRREVVQQITPTLKQQRFGIEPELTAKVARRNFRIYETPIGYSGRTYQEGKKITWRDGMKAFWCILRYWRWD